MYEFSSYSSFNLWRIKAWSLSRLLKTKLARSNYHLYLAFFPIFMLTLTILTNWSHFNLFQLSPHFPPGCNSYTIFHFNHTSSISPKYNVHYHHHSLKYFVFLMTLENHKSFVQALHLARNCFIKILIMSHLFNNTTD